MAFSPFGVAMVVPTWPYLGATIPSRRQDGPHRIMWHPEQLAAGQQATWQRALRRMAERTVSVGVTTASPGRRADVWNTYIVTLVPYPAHSYAPTAQQSSAMQRHLASAMRMGRVAWCPIYILTSLTPYLGAPGSPRCPTATGRAVAALAAYRLDQWGPTPAAARQQTCWAAIQRWAATVPAPDPGQPAHRRMTGPRAAQIIRRHSQHLPGQGPRDPQLSRALYSAEWNRTHGRRALNWFQHRSQQREWAPGHNDEWALITAAPSYTAAYHVLRFLVNGLPSDTRWRHNHRYPHLCCNCNLPANHRWLTNTPTHPGHAWCNHCFAQWADGAAWAALPDDFIPQTLRGEAEAIRANRPPLPGPPHPRRGTYRVCPLCGQGEASNHHLWTWCVTVALAWRNLGLDDHGCLLQTILAPPPQPTPISIFIHQVSYLYCTSYDFPPLEPTTAAQRICAAVRTCHFQDLEDDPPSREAVGTARCELATWASYHGCDMCNPLQPIPSRPRSSAAPTQRTAEIPAGQLRRCPTAAVTTAQGHLIAIISADAPLAAWLVPPDGWWPRPRRVPPHEANAAWTTTYCRHCNTHHASLHALCHIPYDTEITVPSNPSPDYEDALWPFELTFDGGARRIQNDQVAGGGATLWRHNLNGGAPTMIAEAVIAIPTSATAQLAEATACRVGLDLLGRLTSAPRRARVVGDNLAAIRYGAGQGRFRHLPIMAQMEAGLQRLATLGWTTTWQAVRRRLNAAADRRATQGAQWAYELLQQGVREVRTRITWLTESGGRAH